MTVIANLVNSRQTVHATDSLLLSRLTNDDGLRIRHHRSGEPKVIIISRFRGALSWWGSVADGDGWNLYDWLVERIAWLHYNEEEETSAENYAVELTRDLNRILEQEHLNNAQGTKGIGIHFTCYEQITPGVWSPEMYLITNERAPNNQNQYDPFGPFVVSRRTFFDIHLETTGHWDTDYASHADLDIRRFVRDFLTTQNRIYSNGAPEPFQRLWRDIWNRVVTHTISEAEFALSLVRAIADEHTIGAPADRTVGHPCHDVVITQGGHYSSHSSISAIADGRITSLQLRLGEARAAHNQELENQIVQQMRLRCDELGRDLRVSLAAAPALTQL